MIDSSQAGRVRTVLPRLIEFDIPNASKLAAGIQEEDKTASDPAYCRDVELAGTDGLTKRLVEEQLGTLEGSGCIVDF